MSNVVAGIGRGQLLHLEEHRARKEEIYRRYQEGFRNLPVQMNPYLDCSKPNFWLSCMLMDEGVKVSFMDVLNRLNELNIEGRPIWKPMHMQPMYRMHEFVTVSGTGRYRTNAYIAGSVEDVGADIFARGLCLPSDNKMTAEEQNTIIEVIKRCFE